MKEDNNFADVTLACEDGQQVNAHKMILAATSTFFQNLLRRNKHAHPLIFMRNVSSEDLLAVLDFLYHGEANIGEENLESFLTRLLQRSSNLRDFLGKPWTKSLVILNMPKFNQYPKTIMPQKFSQNPPMNST